MKKFNTLSIYATTILSFSFFYLLLFKTPLFAQQKILFYRGVEILLSTMLLYAILAAYLMYSRKPLMESYIAAVCIAASLCLSFLILIPVTVDRSISTYMLDVIEKPHAVCSYGGITRDELQKRFITEYINRYDAIGRRLDEQSKSGTIHKTAEYCFQLTNQGMMFIKVFRIVKNYFGISLYAAR